jgi:uncharacterized protein
MLDFNPTGKKVILSVDGGGMRGTIPIAMLAELEQMTGKPCQQLFHMVGGTSTGAIIAAALALGFTAQETLDMVYKNRLPGAFPPDTLWSNIGIYARYLLGGLRYIYDLEPFRLALQPLSHDKRIRDLSKPIFFATIKDVRTGSTLYVTSAGPGAALVQDWPIAGVVGASGAAPIYFPPVADNLIDGGAGVYANPSLAVATEAMEYIGAGEGFVDGNVKLISLGTGYAPREAADGEAARYWLKDWVYYLILNGIDDASLQQVLVTRSIYGKRIDFSRYNPLLTRQSVSEALGITLRDIDDPAKLELDSRRPHQITLMERIGRAYARLIDWTQPDVMPWQTRGGHALPSMRAAPVDWSKTPFV